MFVVFIGVVMVIVLRISSSNFRHFSPGPDLVIAYSAKINQNCWYIRRKRIFK